MQDTNYAEAIGYLRVLEKRILTKAQIERVVDASDFQEAIKLLSQNSSYDFSSLKRSLDYEPVLNAHLKETYDLLYKISPISELVDVLAAKYDYHNVKVLLKAKYLNKDMDYLLSDVSRISTDTVKKAVLLNEEKEIPEHIIAAVKAGEQAFEASNDPQMLDIAVDKEMFAHMLRLSNEIGSEYISDYTGSLIDFYNLKTLIRVKEMQKGLRFLRDVLVPGGLTDVSLFIENYDKSFDTIAGNVFYKYFGDMVKKSLEIYERTHNFSALEKMTDNYIMELAKKSKYIAFGPEPVFAYILSKENEMRQVRILLTCKSNAIDSAVLRERLRDNYA